MSFHFKSNQILVSRKLLFIACFSSASQVFAGALAPAGAATGISKISTTGIGKYIPKNMLPGNTAGNNLNEFSKLPQATLPEGLVTRVVGKPKYQDLGGVPRTVGTPGKYNTFNDWPRATELQEARNKAYQEAQNALKPQPRKTQFQLDREQAAKQSEMQEEALRNLVNQQIEEEAKSGAVRLSSEEINKIAQSLKVGMRSVRNGKLNKIENLQDRADVLNELNPNQAAQYLESLGEIESQEVLMLMKPEKSKAAEQIINKEIGDKKLYKDRSDQLAKNKADKFVKEAADKKRLSEVLKKDSNGSLNPTETPVAAQQVAKDSSHQSYDSLNKLYNSGSGNSSGRAGSRNYYSYGTAAGYVALAGYVFSLDDGKARSPMAQRVDTANKLYAFCAEVVAQEAMMNAEQAVEEQGEDQVFEQNDDKSAEQEAAIKEAALNIAIAAEFESLEAAGIDGQITKYAQIIKSLYDMIDKLPVSVQERLKQLTNFYGKTVEFIEQKLKSVDIIPISFQINIEQVLPYLKLSAQDFYNKTLPEITRIIQVHVDALENEMIGMEKSLSAKIKLNLLALQEFLKNTPEKASAQLYYLVAQVKDYSNQGSLAIQDYASRAGKGFEYYSNQGDNIGNALENYASRAGESVSSGYDRLSSFTKENLPSASDLKTKIYSTQDAKNIVKALLESAKSYDTMPVTIDNLKARAKV